MFALFTESERKIGLRDVDKLNALCQMVNTDYIAISAECIEVYTKNGNVWCVSMYKNPWTTDMIVSFYVYVRVLNICLDVVFQRNLAEIDKIGTYLF